MGKTSALILAAGKGVRMKSDVPKQFIEIDGKPLFIYSVLAFLPIVDIVTVVTAEEDIPVVQEHLQKFGLFDKVNVIRGGKERFESSFYGIRYLKTLGDVDIVLIHDAARCMVSSDIIERVLEDTKTYRASCAAIPARDTIKKNDGNGFIKETLDRNELQIIQTPQGFDLDLIFASYKAFFKDPVDNMTDDAGIVEKYGDCPVKLTMGSPINQKITTPEDLFLARAWFSLTNENETIMIE